MSKLATTKLRNHTYTVDELTWGWSIAATLCMLTGYAIYIGFIVGDLVKPNATSWLLWAIGGSVEAWSYWKLVQTSTNKRHTKSDAVRRLPRFLPPALSLPSIACAIFVIVLAVVAIMLGKFGWPETWEWVIGVIDLSIVATYLIIKAITKDQGLAAKVASALMVTDIVLSFVPIWYSTWEFPANENLLPWTIWSFSYAIIAVTALIQFNKDWKERSWLFLYPFISALTHGMVGILASMGA